MRTPNALLRILKETSPLIAVIVTGVMLIGFAAPAAAQFFPFFGGGGGPPQRQQPQRGGGGGFGGFFGGGNDGPFFAPFQQAPRRAAPVQREDYSRAPAPDKRDANAPAPERNVLVLGDAMADWLGYGLEDAYSEQPDMGVIRKHKTVSGLLRYQPKGEPADWIAAAKGILAQEKPDAIVVMLGLHDRTGLREPAADRKAEKKAALPAKPGDPAAKPEDKPDAEAAPADDAAADIADPAPIVAPERSARGAPGGAVDFRDDRWAELYSRKIDEMIGVLKSKGVPVLWVGLPAVRGAKATADMLYLNTLYRDAAGRAGITYVDVWDGFVDEGGRYMLQGPDFEGQIRRLRSYDGVFFTKAGARKLAHYAEREITRLLASRTAPVALPAEPAAPEAEVKPGGPAPRPLVGPIVPLVAPVANSDQLLGGPGVKPAAVDALAARMLVRGEALEAPAGRADDAAWPRREVGRETAPRGGDMPVAALTPTTTVTPVLAAPAPPKPKRPRPAQTAQQPSQDPFGFGGPPQRPRPQPRQPGGFGPSAGFGGFNGFFR